MSETETPVKERKKPGPKPKIDALPKVSVLERRLKNPFGVSSAPITLNTPGQWAIRIINSGLRRGRMHDVTHNKGWVFVEPHELDGTPEENGFKAVDNRLVRGEHGEEVLMKMPQAEFDAIVDAKTRLNIKGLGTKAIRESVAQQTAQEYGSEAGDQVYSAFRSVEISESRSPMPLDGE